MEADGEDATEEGMASEGVKAVMKILGDLLSTLNIEASVRDIRQGLFHTAVMTRNCGLAAPVLRTAPPEVLAREAGCLI